MRLLLLGNEAIAYGALSGGVAVATAYPGTPSTEIIETLEEFKDRFVHWATNEKVAFELAYGAALAGARALTAMKHVGLIVAADPLHSAAYTGVVGVFSSCPPTTPGCTLRKMNKTPDDTGSSRLS